MSKIDIKDHHHIDNGGVSVEISQTESSDGYKKFINYFLELSAEYYGYPAIISKIDITMLGPDWLERIGNMFIDTAKKMRANNE